MSIRSNTPCDYDGVCPYAAEFSCSCEYWCGAEEPEDYPEDDGFEVETLLAEQAAEQAEELDAEFETYMLNKYGPAWQVDMWAECGADQEEYNEELQREFDEFMELYDTGSLYWTPDDD